MTAWSQMKLGLYVVTGGTCLYTALNYPELRQSIATGAGLIACCMVMQRYEHLVRGGAWSNTIRGGLVIAQIPLMAYSSRLFTQIAKELVRADEERPRLVVYSIALAARWLSTCSYYSCLFATVTTLVSMFGTQYARTTIIPNLVYLLDRIMTASQNLNTGTASRSCMSLVDIEKVAPLTCAGLSNTPVAHDEVSDNCAVCQDVFNPKTLGRTLPCRHSFHATCVDLWLEQKGTCPICRHSLLPTPIPTPYYDE